MLDTRKVVLAKLETTYGIDPGLTAAADSILFKEAAWQYEDARMYERAVVKPTFGPLKPLFAGSLMGITLNCEIRGSGSAGVAPEIGPLLRACRYAETIVGGTSVTYARSSSATESICFYGYQDGILHVITGAKGNVAFNFGLGEVGMASFTFSGHTKMRGTAVSATATTIVLPATFSATDDAYNGRTIKITSGTGAGQSKTIDDYTGATKTCTVTAWSTTPDATSVFEIDNGPIDAALPTPTFDAAVPVPLIAVPFTIDTYAAIITKLAFDTGNTIVKPGDISSPDGFGTVTVNTHKVTGSIDPEMTLIAAQNWEGKWKSGAAMALDTGVIGTSAGNRYRVQMPGVTYTAAGPGNRDGIVTREMGFMAAETTSDNEVSLAFT